MKFFKYSILAVAATMGVAFSACSDDDNEYQPGPQSQGVYFASSNPSRFNLPTDATSLTINVGREGDLKEADYPVTVTTDLPEGLFTFPGSVHFAQGESNTTYVATCALPEEKEDRRYSLSLAFAPEISICNYGNASINAVVTLLRKVEKFEHYGTALVIDAWLTAAYSFRDGDGNTVTYEECGWEVNLEKSVENPGVYRLVDPWGSEDCVLNYLNINLNYGKGEPQDIRIDASDPDFVIIEPQYTGVIWNNQVSDGKDVQCYIGNMAGALLKLGQSKEDIIARGLATVLQDGTTLEIVPAPFGWDDDPSEPNGQFGFTWNSNPTAVIEFYEGQELETQTLKSLNRRQNNIAALKVAEMIGQIGFRSL